MIILIFIPLLQHETQFSGRLDQAFELKLKEICKALVHEGRPSTGSKWKAYPENGAILRHKEEHMLEVVSNIQGEACQMWKQNGFDQFGWQN